MISTIKNAIDAKLQALVVANTLGAATITDIRKDPLAEDIPGDPHAFLMPPAVEGVIEDNRTIIRTYTFDIMIVFKALNLTGTSQVESTIEAVLEDFDNDPTLGGTCMAGIPPTSSAPAPIQHAGQDLIIAIIQVQAKEVVELTFS